MEEIDIFLIIFGTIGILLLICIIFAPPSNQDTSCITKVNDNYCECGRSCE